MILVTGSDGFIAKNLITKLEDVIKLERFDCFEKLSQLDWSKITKIYHLGAISSTVETDIDFIYRYNIAFTLLLFQYSIKYHIPVVYASSASVYGNSSDYQINPLNYYALSKATVDLWVQDNMNKFQSIIGLRYFNVYGKFEEHKGNQASPIHQFEYQVKTTGKIKLFEGSENFIRDFVFVDDVINCTLTDKPSGIYDVGTSNPISFQKIAEIFAKKYNATIDIIPFPNHLKDKYQKFTCARKHFEKKFITVEEYLNGKI